MGDQSKGDGRMDSHGNRFAAIFERPSDDDFVVYEEEIDRETVEWIRSIQQRPVRPERSSCRTELGLCLLSLVILAPLFWTLARIVADVVLDLPMEQQPWSNAR